MSKTGVVQVSGTGSGVDFTIDDTLPFDQVANGLRRYLMDNRRLWSKGTITINAGLRIGSREQLNELKTIIEKESGLRVARFWCLPETIGLPQSQEPDTGSTDQTAASGAEIPEVFAPQETAPPDRPLAHNEYPLKKTATQAKNGAGQNGSAIKTRPSADPGNLGGLQTGPSVLDLSQITEANGLTENDSASHTTAVDQEPALPGHRPEPDDLDMPNYKDSRRDTALFVKSTCRSGESIHYQGDVVVLGDVNPGAEIVAAGDITVFGTLRGLAHAGSGGLTKAAIIAYRIESPRLQIGPYAGLAANPAQIAEEQNKSTGSGPMIAYVRRRSIFVAPFVGRFARYSRGILYEG